jgi:hypothetical protein
LPLLPPSRTSCRGPSTASSAKPSPSLPNLLSRLAARHSSLRSTATAARWLGRLVLRSARQRAQRQGSQLDGNRARQSLVRDPPPLRSARVVVRQDLAAKRDRNSKVNLEVAESRPDREAERSVARAPRCSRPRRESQFVGCIRKRHSDARSDVVESQNDDLTSDREVQPDLNTRETERPQQGQCVRCDLVCVDSGYFDSFFPPIHLTKGQNVDDSIR